METILMDQNNEKTSMENPYNLGSLTQSSPEMRGSVRKRKRRTCLSSGSSSQEWHRDGYQSSNERSDTDDEKSDGSVHVLTIPNDSIVKEESEKINADKQPESCSEKSYDLSEDKAEDTTLSPSLQAKPSFVFSGPFVRAFNRVFKRSRSSSPKILPPKDETLNISSPAGAEDVSENKEHPICTSVLSSHADDRLVKCIHGAHLDSKGTTRTNNTSLYSNGNNLPSLSDRLLPNNRSIIRKVSVTSTEGDEILLSTGIDLQVTETDEGGYVTGQSRAADHPWISYRCKRNVSGDVIASASPSLVELQSSQSFHSLSSIRSQLNRQTAVSSDAVSTTVGFLPKFYDSEATAGNSRLIEHTTTKPDAAVPTFHLDSNTADEASVQPALEGQEQYDGVRRTSSEQSLVDSLFLPTCVLDEECNKSSINFYLKDSQRQPSLRDLPGLLRILSRRKSPGVEAVTAADSPNSLSVDCDFNISKSLSVSPTMSKLSPSKSLGQPLLTQLKPVKQSSIPTFTFSQQNQRQSSDYSTDNEVFSSLEDAEHYQEEATATTTTTNSLKPHPDDSGPTVRRNSFFSSCRSKRRSNSYDCGRKRRRSCASSPDEGQNPEAMSSKPEAETLSKEDDGIAEPSHPECIPAAPPRRSKLRDISCRLKKDPAGASSVDGSPIAPIEGACGSKPSTTLGSKLGRVAGYLQRGGSKLVEQQRRLKQQLWSCVVTVVLVECRDLLPMDPDGMADSYVKCKLGTEKYKSKTDPRTLNPRWLEQFDFHLYDDQSHILEVSVWDKDARTKDDFMGKSLLDLSEFPRERTHDVWTELLEGAGRLHLLLTISGTTSPETCSDLHSYREDPREIQLIRDRYKFRKSLANLKDVGYLVAKVFRAQGLASADIGGKSDPFCVLELVNDRVQTHTEYKTLTPTWNKIFTFHVRDIHSVLELTVYDEDRDHKVEFLGKVAVPLLKIINGEKKWYALKDKKMRTRAKGHYPEVLMELSVYWNSVRAAIRTFTPPEEKFMQKDLKFNRQIFIRNVNRLKGTIAQMVEGGVLINRIFTWENPMQSGMAFVGFLLGVYYFEMYMIPIALLGIFFKNYVVISLVGSLMHKDDDLETSSDNDEDEDDDKDKEEKKSLKERLVAIQEVTATVQNAIGFIASMQESVKNTFNFSVPFLSWLMVVALAGAAVVLYYVPLRALVLLVGVNKFLKQLLRPNTINNNELIDFLARVPDDENLRDYREIRLSPTMMEERRRELRKKKLT